MKGVPLNDDLYSYILNTFVDEDEILKSILEKTKEHNLPQIHISPENGKILYLLAKMIKAVNAIEIGTLAGYSSIWIARALPENGKLITIEYEQSHAIVSAENFKNAGLENKINLIHGDAREILDRMRGEKFDFAFIDADKVSYPEYFRKLLPLINSGGLIAADNTLRDGEIIKNIADEGTKAVQKYNSIAAKEPSVISLLIPISDGLTISYIK